MAECAAGRTVAEVAAHVGVTRATVERWRRQPEFAAAIARYRFGWSRRRLRALALMAPDRPGPPLYLREVCGLLARAAACSRGRTARDVSPAHGGACCLTEESTRSGSGAACKNPHEEGGGKGGGVRGGGDACLWIYGELQPEEGLAD